MTADTQKQTPKLRFPEFQDAGEWSVTKLREVIIEELREKNKPNEYYTGLGVRSHGKGTFLKESQDPEKISMDYLYEVHENDLVVSITFAWEGAIAIAGKQDQGALVSHRFPTYIFDSQKVLAEFFQYIITRKSFFHRLSLISPGGAGRNRVMNKKDFLEIITNIPHIQEQQKIADFLGSLDELIAAESQKLEALKTYKKGMMQQLFPAEGETVPKLRFPEFRDAPAWEAKELQPFIEEFKKRVAADTKLPIYSSTRSGLIPQKKYYGGSQLLNEGEYGVVPEGYFVYRHMSDDEVFKFNINNTGGEIAVSKEYPVFTTVGLDHQFFYYKLNHKDFLRFAAEQRKGGTRTRLYLKVLSTWRTLLPSLEEQKCIADFLSSVDRQINTQSAKLEILKQHKQGLMQQLFPTSDELQSVEEDELLLLED